MITCTSALWVFLLAGATLLRLTAGQSEQLQQPCDSKIYCTGELLHTVQMAEVFPDSKHFVDMSLQQSPEKTYAAFLKFMRQHGDNPSKEAVKGFVEDHFNEPGDEFEPWEPSDWTDSPPVLANITDARYVAWARALNAIWKKLGRVISSKVKEHPELYSQIYVDHPVVVPGGRFREFYYWDSYWTIDGLLLCGMAETVKGMLSNFLQMVATYGMIPNGGRVYYTRRSQPPYVIPMMERYVTATGDLAFLREHVDGLERELLFWVHNRTRDVIHRGVTYTVAQYNVQVDAPRPESYREDYEVAASIPESARPQLYVEYKSGAESGWDYSGRWIVNGNSNRGDLRHLSVTSILPVDLNSLLCYNARLLSGFYAQLGDAEKAATYAGIHRTYRHMLTQLFYDERDGVWYDVNRITMKKRRYFYLSNIHPLWSGCYDEADSERVVKGVIDYLKRTDVLDFVGGVPQSKSNTGEQWDLPNAWAPSQHTLIMALLQARHVNSEAGDVARNLTDKWLRSNYVGYVETLAMYEKYNVHRVGAPGGGGEYEVQAGFGWTNGVALRLLAEAGDWLVAPDVTGPGANSAPRMPHAPPLSLFAAVIGLQAFSLAALLF